MAQTPREKETARLYRALVNACQKDAGMLPEGADESEMFQRVNDARESLEALRKILREVPRLFKNERRRLIANLRDVLKAEVGEDGEGEDARKRAGSLLAEAQISGDEEDLGPMWAAVDEMHDIARPKDSDSMKTGLEDIVPPPPSPAKKPVRSRPMGYTEKLRPRRSFAKHRAQSDIPALMQLQKSSYRDFLQRDDAPNKRARRGLQGAFLDVFPIESSSGAVSLHFKEYELRLPKYTVPECKLRGLTYQSSVYAKIEMQIFERRGGPFKEAKREKVYMGEIPLMTDDGSFVINGTERVVVSQLHRSPGVLFEHDFGRNTSGGKYIYSARIIPYSGSWLDFEFDKRDFLFFRIDRKRKLPVTILLKALGYDKERILREFYEFEEFQLGEEPGGAKYKLESRFLANVSLPFDIVKGDRTVVSRNHRIKKIDIKRLASMEGAWHPVGDDFLIGRRLAGDIEYDRLISAGAGVTPDLIAELAGGLLQSDFILDDGEVFASAGDRIQKTQEAIAAVAGRRLARDVIVRKIIGSNTEIDAELLAEIRAYALQVKNIKTLYVNEFDHGPFIAQTLALDEKLDQEKSRETIYRMLRPGDPPNREVVNNHLDAILYDSASYNMSRVGRMKFNRRLYPGQPTSQFKLQLAPDSPRMNKGEILSSGKALAAAGCFGGDLDAAVSYLEYVRHFSSLRAIAENLSEEEAKKLHAKLKPGLRTRIAPQFTLSRRDILAVVKYLVDLRNGKQKPDDIDNLSNRRIRAVGEFVENQFHAGLQRVNRAIRDRLSRAEIDNLMPHNLISAKAVSSSVAEFFNGNQLSQFMDQTNPLAEITHKRRVSALGVGGLNRDRVGFEVRDVHPSHYGRICPIETPEGPNIGLINSMGLYAEVDEYGFLRTPYVKVKNGAATGEVVKLAAIDETDKTIAQAGSNRDKKGRFTDELVSARRNGEFILCAPENVDYVDIAPSQVASVAASLIPFLEHDDANRALMGSNMQRQGVPCLRPEKPLVGTGLERLVVSDSGSLVQARRGGTVSFVDASRIAVRAADSEMEPGKSGVDIYSLQRYARSNQDTCISQRPVVQEGDVIAAGDVIADGSVTDLGELALGQNLLVAFLPWNGYNFEDSILVSERVVSEQRFASIHILEEIVHARGTQLGDEEITRDIPHQSASSISHLDDEGIVEVGVHVKPGDILVGKITPKSERQLTPEEKLLRAVFGEKAADVKDTSLRMPPGSSGVVIDVKVFAGEEAKGKKKKSGMESGRRMKAVQDLDLAEFERGQAEALRIIEEDAMMRIRALAEGRRAAASVAPLKKGQVMTATALSKVKKADWGKIAPAGDEKAAGQIKLIASWLKSEASRQKEELKIQTAKLREGHALPTGILKTIKVYVAIKRNLQAGDKMAGRHGNKGVVSKVVPAESMPYLEDGTPVDVVLSPLGVPSRMNVGQILETHLGLAAKGLGAKIDEMLHAERKKQVKGLRAFLKKVFAGDGGGFDMSLLTDDEIVETARHLKSGVPFATPIFDGASQGDIRAMLELGDLPPSGQMTLYDGYSGEPFERPVTVGYMYMLKLHHLVDEKMHARSTGPYALITQQPLGGKAQRGGQRFGEMEVWALEAYGAAYTLREMLTTKSDDISGRNRMLDGIMEGDLRMKVREGMPESFNVLKHEIRAIGIDMDPR